MARISGPGVREMRELAVRLGHADRVAARELRKRLRLVAVPAARDAQQAILSADARRPGDFRAHIARTVRVSVSAAPRRGPQIWILSDGKKMPPREGNLPAHANRGWWRHPVFGNPEKWVLQLWPSAKGWFSGTLTGRREQFAVGADRAVRDTAAYLEHGHR